jgi:phage protein U
MINLIPATIFRGLDRVIANARAVDSRSDVMMQLGEYQFSMNTSAYESFTRSYGWKWAAQERLGRLPAMQFTGPEAQTIKLAGTILPLFRGGMKQIDAMVAQANKGNPLMLVDGRGYVHGLWCISAIEEGQSWFAANGAPRKMDFDITLVQYGEDR